MATTASQIRVLHFADLVNRHDFIDNVVRHADPEVFRMSVCTLGRPSNIEDPAYHDAGIPFCTLGPTGRPGYPRVVVGLAALLRRERIDIIHAHHYEPSIIACLATFLHPSTRLIVGRHYSDAIYLHTRGWHQGAMLGLERLVNNRAQRIVVPSRRIEALLVDRQHVSRDKVALIPYGFDRSKYDGVDPGAVAAIRTELGMNGRFTIATFGRLYPDKGHRYLLDALPRIRHHVPNITYLVVGDGAERATLERQVERLDLGDVVSFTGWRSDVCQLLAAVDVVVQPSLQEAFSQSMAEALFMGRPLIAGDVSGTSDLIPDARTGVVVPCRDSEALARAVIELARDTPRRSALAQAGREHARRNFTIDRVVPSYEALYQACLEERDRRPDVTCRSGRTVPRRPLSRSRERR